MRELPAVVSKHGLGCKDSKFLCLRHDLQFRFDRPYPNGIFDCYQPDSAARADLSPLL